MHALNYLAKLVRERSGIVVGPDKQYLLESRLAPLLRQQGMAHLDELVAYLGTARRDDLEQDITEAVATHETLFFRDSKPFEHLRNVAVPALLQARPPGARLRVWSAAASTGQETYSIAMTLQECGLGDRSRADIVGTDLAREALQRARDGLYTQYEVQRGLSVHRLVQHFTKEGQQWRVRDTVSALCRFRQWNLLDDPAPLGRFDVVFCRNVLFYFDRRVRAQVLGLIRKQMAPDGLLYLGAAETASGLDNRMERQGPAYRLCETAVAAGQPIAPRADTGQRHSTRPSLTPTYQS